MEGSDARNSASFGDNSGQPPPPPPPASPSPSSPMAATAIPSTTNTGTPASIFRPSHHHQSLDDNTSVELNSTISWSDGASTVSNENRAVNGASVTLNQPAQPTPPISSLNAPTVHQPAQPPVVPAQAPAPASKGHTRDYSEDPSLVGASSFSSSLGAPSPRVNPSPSTGVGTFNTNIPNASRKVNPLECEAESLILKALENHEAITRNSRSRADTGSVSLLGSDAPPEAVRMFLGDTLTAAEAASTGFTGGGMGGGGSVKSNNTTSATGVAGGTPTQPSPALHPPAAAASTKPPLAPIAIKRNHSTAQTLADLTLALEAIHDPQYVHHDDTVIGGAGVNNAGLEFVHNAGLEFVHNANLVFQGHRLAKQRRSSGLSNSAGSHTSGGSPPVRGQLLPSPTAVSITAAAAPPTASATQNWSKLRHAVSSTNAIGRPSTSSPSNGADGPTMEIYGHDDVECPGITTLDGSKPSTTNQAPPLPTQAAHQNAASRLNSKPNRKGNGALMMAGPTKGAVHDLQLFVGQRRRMFFIYVNYLMFVVVPATTLSAVLFYFLDNPSTGKIDLIASTAASDASGEKTLIRNSGDVMGQEEASASWWILFICVRQALTFSMAHLWQVFIIDFLCLNTKIFQTILGNLLTLLIVQSKGWPFIAVTWGVLDFGLLHGPSKFASNWLFWQDIVDIFNEVNPSGNFTSHISNTRILLVAVCVGLVVSVKRLWMGLFLGKKTYTNHADDLQKVYRKVVLLCEVAALARDLQQNPSFRRRPTTIFGMDEDEFDGMLRRTTETNDQQNLEKGGSLDIGPSDSDSYQGNLNDSERRSMLEMLGAWEEPEADMEKEESVSISAILLFQNLVTIFDNPFMFSIAWGDVSTRDLMVDSSEKVFKRLALGSPDPSYLKFDVLARIAKGQNGCLDQDKLGDLIRLLRPNRDGNLNLIDFVKSIDSVYKEAKLLRASIRNSGKIDGAFEKAINILFYTIVFCIILSQIGIDPYALFLSLSPLVLASAFMIGTAASKMFEGWLFILVRRPYDIGDRIHISNSEAETDSSGSSGWVVKDVNLFHTTAVFAATNETATLSNGSLAGSRVINMARSPHASISVAFKFSTREPFEKIQIFDSALREYIKERPREWSKFGGFRVSDVQSDLGFVEYTVLLTHREAWQNIGAILASKATVASFCLELSKKLDMRYQRPPLPVDLAVVQRNAASSEITPPSWAEGDETAGLKDLVALYDKNK